VTVEMRSLVACAACTAFWYEGEEAICSDPGHTHSRHEMHVHRTLLVLPDGTEVTAVSFDARDPYARERRPDYGLYLDERWQPPWDHGRIAWPDFGLPTDRAAVLDALRALLDRARAGDHVELGCLGGHGRTGTALGCLAVLSGHPPSDAVAWVRAAYCASAVETPEQEAFVAALDPAD
jgi:hypothetical protein